MSSRDLWAIISDRKLYSELLVGMGGVSNVVLKVNFCDKAKGPVIVLSKPFEMLGKINAINCEHQVDTVHFMVEAPIEAVSNMLTQEVTFQKRTFHIPTMPCKYESWVYMQCNPAETQFVQSSVYLPFNYSDDRAVIQYDATGCEPVRFEPSWTHAKVEALALALCQQNMHLNPPPTLATLYWVGLEGKLRVAPAHPRVDVAKPLDSILCLLAELCSKLTNEGGVVHGLDPAADFVAVARQINLKEKIIQTVLASCKAPLPLPTP